MFYRTQTLRMQKKTWPIQSLEFISSDLKMQKFCDLPLDVRLIVEGVKVLKNLGDVTKACALLLGVIYSLTLSYPPDLKYTFEFFLKVLLGLDAQKLSHKIQVLKLVY